MVHGSETEPAIDNNRAYLLAARGVTVFTFDKRGTGQSGGFYTQNFELLADDAAAAMAHAQTMTRGHFNRSGYWGQSQGGWVAPLAATRSTVDFVAVGFGLITSPIDEDRDQMLLEAQTMGLNDQDKAKLDDCRKPQQRSFRLTLLLASRRWMSCEKKRAKKNGPG
jgi:alpha/beta superfamily hydrolase